MVKSIAEGVKRAWSAWKRIAQKIGNFQARVLLTIIYVTVVLPFGLIVRLFSDSLQIRNRPTKWIEEPQEFHDLTWARKQ